MNCKTMIDTGGPRMVFNQAIGRTVYTAMCLSTDEIAYCTSGNTPCIPQNFAGNIMPFTFSGSSAMFQVTGANSSSCQDGYCGSEFDVNDVDADIGSGSAYFGATFIEVSLLC